MAKAPVNGKTDVKPIAAKPQASVPKPAATEAVSAKPAPVKVATAKAIAPKAVAPVAVVVATPPIVEKITPIEPAAPAAPMVEPVLQEPAAPAMKAEKLFVPEPAQPEAAAPKTTKTKGLTIMEDTVKQVQETAHKLAADATAHVENFVAGATEKTKEAVEKSKKMAEDAVAFHKENAEAVAASGKMVAEGVQSSAAYAAELGRKHFEEASAALKTMAAAKSPSEFFSLQSDYMKSSYEAFIAETSKSSEATMKFFGEVFQPISSRFAVAAEKVKAATTL